MTSKEMGNIGEAAVCKYLIKKGYKIIERNFSYRGGEIDIIAQDKSTIVFIEVKARKRDCMVSGVEAVNRSKKKKIIKTAAYYSYKKPLKLQPRFDIAEVILEDEKAVAIRYYDEAFDMSGFNIMFSMA